MIKQPPYLKKGDKVALVCPAKSLPKSIDAAVATLQSWGLEVVLGETISSSFHQFAGNDQLRALDLQTFLDDEEVKAVIAGRGGYGTIRIIDQLDFTKFQANPKWLVGFSDITILLSHVYAGLGIHCIHGQMPYTFETSTTEALQSLRNALFGTQEQITYRSAITNTIGSASGILVGGNLTLLVALLGSSSELDFSGKILFLEDVGEHEYAIDRMMRTLDRAGKLHNLKALIVGAINEIPEEKIPFGQTPEEVVAAIVSKYNFPVCYQFPTGHIEDNRALIIGRDVQIDIQKQDVTLTYL